MVSMRFRSIAANALLLGAACALAACGGSPMHTNAMQARANKKSVTLSWEASSTTGVSYNVYRAMVSGGPYGKLNSAPIWATTYIDTAVRPTKTYYYVTTAVNTGGVESAYSNQAYAKVP